MPRIFKGLLGLIILIGTIGLATCQSLVKAEPSLAKTAVNLHLNR